MTENNVVELIVDNKCRILEGRDLQGNKLFHIEEPNAESAATELIDVLEHFKNDFKKINIHGKGEKLENWSKGFVWTLDYPKAQDKPTTTVGNNNNGGVGVMEFIGMMQKHSDSQMQLHKEIMELKMAQNQSDPTKWMPIVNAFLPILGVHPQAQGMAGPQNKTLEFADVKNLSDQQIAEALQKNLDEIATKVKGSQMCRLLVAMNSNPSLPIQIDKINSMLEAIAKNPALVDMAANYIK